MKSTTASGPAVALVQGSSHQGAALLDRVVLFGRAPAPVSQADVKLPAAAGGGSVKVLLCDLEAGSYAVKRDGGLVGYYSATAAGGCIYFSGGAGSYTVAPGAPLDAGAGSDASGAGDSAGPGADGLASADGNVDSGDGGGGSGGKRADDGCSCQTGGLAGTPVASLLLLLLLVRRINAARGRRGRCAAADRCASCGGAARSGGGPGRASFQCDRRSRSAGRRGRAGWGGRRSGSGACRPR